MKNWKRQKNVDAEIKIIENSDKTFEKIHDKVGLSQPRRKSQIMKKGIFENPSQRRIKKIWSDKRSEEEMPKEKMMQEEYQLEYISEKEEITPIQERKQSIFIDKSLDLSWNAIGNHFK
jgi:hypothetical protein